MRNILDQQRKDIECMKVQASESEARISFLLHQVQDKDALVAAKENQVEQSKTELERVLRDLETLKEEHKEYSNQLKGNFEKVRIRIVFSLSDWGECYIFDNCDPFHNWTTIL